MDSHISSFEREARSLATVLRPLSAEKRISRIMTAFAGATVVTTSFGPTSAVLLHMVSAAVPGIRVLHVRHGHETEATLRFAEDCQRKFQIDLRTYDAPRLEIPSWGTPEFEEFCRLVKIEPMQRALEEEKAKIWLAGLIHNETRERRAMRLAQPRLGAIAVYPILDWVLQDAIEYCSAFDLKLNEEYFDPCKGPEQKMECGLHSEMEYQSLRNGEH